MMILAIVFLTFLFIIPLFTIPSLSQNLSTDINLTANETSPPNQPATEKSAIEIISFIPQTFKIGDVQFNIKIKNNRNETLNNIIALISGKEFSTYDITPIDSLEENQRDYILVSGNFKESGNITLTIKINEQTFYQNISVINENQADIDEKLKQQQDKIDTLNNLSQQLQDLKQRYSQLETDYYNKKDLEYDLSKVNLDDLKKYINEIESAIINEGIKEASAKLILANEAYSEQKKKLDESQTRSLIMRIKDNALIFSTITGAVLAFFTLYELLKRKSENVVQGVKVVNKKIKKPAKEKKR